jgi:ubiquinone/menaquinone biosynthesis C-methylase UbiE
MLSAAMTDHAVFWNQIADKYAQKPVANPDAFERKIAIHLGHIRPHHVALDIGCGTGSLALRLAPHASHVHGLDLSQEMIRIARDKARQQAVENVSFDVGPFDASLTRFAPASLDVVSAYSLLHLVSERSQALAQVFALLKPGGVFVSSNVCLADSWVPYRPLLAIMHALGKAPPVRLYSRKTLERELREAGFVDLQQPDVGADKTIAFVVAFKPRE